MKRSIFILISLSTFLFSCAIPEENFSYRYAQIWCKKWKSCDKDEFNEVWEEGIAQCEEDSEYLIETFLNLGYALGGTYDADSAGACLTDLKRSACSEFRDMPGSSTSCDDVVD